MRCRFWIVLLVLLSNWNGFSQEKFIQHQVAKGETVSKIAQQYHVKQAVIYEINPDAKKGIKYKEILLVPVSSSAKNEKVVVKVSEEVIKQDKHKVLAKETLYGIAKQYGVKVTDLYALNPSLEKRGLRVGTEISVPAPESTATKLENTSKPEILKVESKLVDKAPIAQVIDEKQDTVNADFIIDADGNQLKEVLAKETLYGIATKYGITVAELERVNPAIGNQPLQIGQKLIIPKNNVIQLVPEKVNEVATNKVAVDVKEAVTETVETKTEEVDPEVQITHEVLPKETKYGIAKEFGLTVKELEVQNPKVTNKLLIVGEKLTIRTLKSNIKTPPKDYFSEENLDDNLQSTYNVKSFHGTDFIDQLVSTASENIGVRYRTGGVTKDGFDCSGLMCTTFGAFDIQLPRTSFEQSQYGVKVSNEEAQKGDLIFFKTNGRSQINHVGMVVEVADGDIKFIHASVGGGVIISSIKEKYYSKRLTQINRVL